MNSDIRKLIAQRPFAPFTIHLADGSAVPVPNVDHIHVFPDGGRAILLPTEDALATSHR